MECWKYKINQQQIINTILRLLKSRKSVTSIDVARSLGVPIECLVLHEVTIDTILLSYGIKTTKIKYCPKCKKSYTNTSLKVCPVHPDQRLIPINKYEK